MRRLIFAVILIIMVVWFIAFSLPRSWLKSDEYLGTFIVIGLPFLGLIIIVCAGGARDSLERSRQKQLQIHTEPSDHTPPGQKIAMSSITDVPEIHTGPPDDTPPGIIATLLFSQNVERAILATLIDLANRGAILIEKSGHAFHLVDREKASSTLEREILRIIFENDITIKFREMRQRILRGSYSLGKSFMKETIRAGLRDESGAKTGAGRQTAEKWLPFRKYLGQIRKTRDVEQFKTQWERYLPYAIAFGQEASFLETVGKIGVPMPSWDPAYHATREATQKPSKHNFRVLILNFESIINTVWEYQTESRSDTSYY